MMGDATDEILALAEQADMRELELSPQQVAELDDEDDSTEEITITATWETTHNVTVPKGWRPTEKLSDFPQHVLEEMRSDDPSASLLDWR